MIACGLSQTTVGLPGIDNSNSRINTNTVVGNVYKNGLHHEIPLAISCTSARACLQIQKYLIIL